MIRMPFQDESSDESDLQKNEVYIWSGDILIKHGEYSAPKQES